MLIFMAIVGAWLIGNFVLMLGLFLFSGGMADLRAMTRIGERRVGPRDVVPSAT